MKKIYLIDANSFIYRMFYGVPEMVTRKGEYVNAIFGIARFFLVQMKYENPDYLIFVKDAKWKNFRHDLDENYKATRDKMPDNLRSQMPIISDMVKKMWVPIIEIEGFEADDVIWTLANKYCSTSSPKGEDWGEDYEVDVLTWDKDLYSLVSKNVCIYDTMKKKKFWIDETIEKFWVKPELIIDYLAIVWDKADNIPGIDWFGPKKAVTLLNDLWSIEEIYKVLDKYFLPLESKGVPEEGGIFPYWDDSKKVFKWKNLEKLENSRENAFLSKKLATIELNVDLPDFDLEKFKFTPEKYITPEITTLFRELEFNSLLPEEAPKLKKWEDLKLDVKVIDDDKKLDKLFEKINPHLSSPEGDEYEEKKIVLDIETTSLDIMKAKLVWVSIYLNDDNIFYINRLHKWNKVSDEKLRLFLKNIFDLDILIIWHNIKYDLEIIDLFLNEKKEDNYEEKFWQISLDI